MRWALSALLACALAPRTLAAPPSGAPQAELIQREDEPDERPLEDEVRALDARVSEVRERIFRTKARLAGLQELVTGEDAAAGARAIVRHRNEMGGSFVLEAVTYAIDGSPVFTETNATGELEKKPEIEVFAGRLAPGHHVVGVSLVYRVAEGGEPRRVKLEASQAFDAQQGKVTTVRATGVEKKGATVADRASVRFRADAEPEREAPPAGGGSGRR